MKICSLLPSATEILFALGRGDDLVGVTVVEFRDETTELLFGLVLKTSKRSAGDGVERGLRPSDAMMYRPGKLTIEQQKRHDRVSRDQSEGTSIRFEAAGRP